VENPAQIRARFSIKPVAADLAFLKDTNPASPREYPPALLQLWRKAVRFAEPCLTHKAAQGGRYELIPPNGVLLSGCWRSIQPIDSPMVILCRALGGSRLAPYCTRTYLWPRSAQAMKAFEVSRSADTA